MVLKCLGSSSAGNGYLLITDTETLIIELGVRFKNFKQALNFDLSKVVGCIVTHAHGDHSCAVRDAVKSGLDVVMSRGTQEYLNIQSHRIKSIAHGKKVKMGNFEVMAFAAEHDCPGKEPLGYLIRHDACGVICFITDSYYIPYTFPDVTHFLVEANYCEKILNDRMVCGKIHPAQGIRTKSSHMSIETCKQLLMANDLKKVVNIVLIHLSDGNADAKRFKQEVKDLTRCHVEVATKGMSLSMLKTPF
jgi:phosphoribosyl 1,2-cyclic phosphodiesterase